MDFYVKLDWSIDLSPHADALINRPSERGLYSNPISREDLFTLVPELGRLDTILRNRGSIISYASVLCIKPGTYGTLHVDGNLPEDVHDLRFNIPILNGTKMTTRWYDLTGLPYDKIDWKIDVTNPNEADLWFRNHQDLLVDHHCIDSVLLDGPYLFNSGYPHNVDGRHSTVMRSVLGMIIRNMSTGKALSWNDRQLFLDSVKELTHT